MVALRSNLMVLFSAKSMLMCAILVVLSVFKYCAVWHLSLVYNTGVGVGGFIGVFVTKIPPYFSCKEESFSREILVIVQLSLFAKLGFQLCVVLLHRIVSS